MDRSGRSIGGEVFGRGLNNDRGELTQGDGARYEEAKKTGVTSDEKSRAVCGP